MYWAKRQLWPHLWLLCLKLFRVCGAAGKTACGDKCCDAGYGCTNGKCVKTCEALADLQMHFDRGHCHTALIVPMQLREGLRIWSLASCAFHRLRQCLSLRSCECMDSRERRVFAGPMNSAACGNGDVAVCCATGKCITPGGCSKDDDKAFCCAGASWTLLSVYGRLPMTDQGSRVCRRRSTLGDASRTGDFVCCSSASSRLLRPALTCFGLCCCSIG